MARVTVGTSAVEITPVRFVGWIRNGGANSVFIDTASDVTTSTGYELTPGRELPVSGTRYYAIAASTGQRIDRLPR